MLGLYGARGKDVKVCEGKKVDRCVEMCEKALKTKFLSSFSQA